MLEITIRKSETDDCDAIVSFIRLMLQEMSSTGGHPVNQNESFWMSFKSTILASITKPDKLYLVAESGTNLIGFIEGRVGRPYDVFETKKSFHISAIYVNPEIRKKGIATNLLRTALRWAKENGCQEADLNVFADNKAKVLYEKLGFRIFRYEMRMDLPTS